MPSKAVIVIASVLGLALGPGLSLAQEMPALSAADQARVAARYKEMLGQNPAEGTALDRLWKMSQENSTTGALIDEYKRAADKNDFPAALILGHLLRKAGEPDAARDAFRRAAALNPQSPLPHLALASLSTERSDPKTTAGEYATAADLMPPSDAALPDLLLKLGSAWLAAGDQAAASTAWERVIALDPQNGELRRKLAENYVSNGLLAKAVPHYEFIAANGSGEQRARALQSLARVYRIQGDSAAAILSLERAIELTAPGNWLRAELESGLIREYQRSNTTDQLEQKWSKAAEENPRDPEMLRRLAGLYQLTGKLDRECGALKKLCDLLPSDNESKIKLARLYERLEQPDNAATVYDQALQAEPDNADIVFARANIDILRDAPRPARDRIDALLAAHPADEALRTRAVEFYSRHRMFDAIEDHLRAAAGHDENSALALASFYFSQRREGDARRTLLALVKNDDPPEKQAAARLKIANALKEQKDLRGAAEQLRHAVALQPRAREYHLALGDACIGLGDPDGAQAELEQAFDLGANEQEKLEADTKLYQAFQLRTPQVKVENPVGTPGPPRPVPRRNVVTYNIALQQFLAKMIGGAAAHPSVDALLRITRWESWLRKNKEAIEFAGKAVALDPSSIPAREMLVKAAAQEPATAIEQLRALVKLNPEKETAYLRQIGRLQMSSGDTDDALDLFAALEKSKPGDADVAADLAVALQQTGRQEEALAAWRRAFDLAPPPRRKEIAPALVHALEKQNSNQDAAAVLLKIVDEDQDDTERDGLFHDLLAFCARHELSGWLQGVYEQKLRANADDYFTQAALSKILKANGRDADSLRLLNEAAFSARDQEAALRELVAAAAENGDFDMAADDQKRLIALAPQDDPADMEKLAALQEAGLALEAAAATWENLAAGFPRDPDALSQASDYFRRWNQPEKSRALLRKVVALDPAGTDAALALGELAVAAGDSREAIACFEKILRDTAARDDGGQFHFPALDRADPDKIQQSYFAVLRLRNGQPSADTMRALRAFWEGDGAKPAGEAGARRRAIREISTLLVAGGDQGAMLAWLARWRSSPSESEAMWAYYYSGAHDQLFKQLDDLMRRDPDNRQLCQGFIWLALQAGRYGMLGRWAADPGRTIDDRDLLMIALGQKIGTGTVAGTALADGLFPADSASWQSMWQVAVQLASRGDLDGAIRLGTRVFHAASSQRAGYGVELAHWHLYAGDVEAARRVLREAITGEGTAPTSPVYDALREYYLLLPANERAAFIDSYARTAGRSPLHSALSLALLYGLHGDTDQARAQLALLIAMRPMAARQADDASPANRTWNFISATGVQFQAWNLNSLAVDLWEMALADEAAIHLQSADVTDIVREIRIRLFAEKLVNASRVDAMTMLDGWVRADAAENAFTLGTLLEGTGWPRRAVWVYQRLWHAQPANQSFLQNLLNASSAAGDTEAEKSALADVLAGTDVSSAGGAYLQASLQLIDLLTEQSKEREALKVTAEGLESFPQNRELLSRKAALLGRARQYDAAEKTWRLVLASDPGDAGARESLVKMLDDTGRTRDAIDLLARSGAADIKEQTALANLHLKSGDNDRAWHAAWTVLKNRGYDKIPALADAFAAKGLAGEARRLVLVALDRAKDAGVQFDLRAKLLDILPDSTPRALVEALMARQRDCASESEGAKNYFGLMERVAKKFHLGDTIHDELAAQWRNGSGQLGAGLSLARTQAEAGQTEKLRATCEALFARNDFDEKAMDRISDSLEHAGQFSLLEKGWGAAAHANPLHERPALSHIRALASCGRKSDAAAALEIYGARRVFDDAAAATVAMEFFREKDFESAARWFDTAVNITAVSGDEAGILRANYAGMLLDWKKFPEARAMLLESFRLPGTGDAGLLARYFIESGQEDAIDAGVREFDLDPETSARFYGGVILRHQQDGEPAKAISVAERHPEIVTAVPGLPATLREAAATAGAWDRVCGLLEKILAQSPPDGDEAGLLSHELARLYREWRDPAHAIPHLERAAALEPDDYDTVDALCKLYLDTAQPQRAAKALTAFITTTQNRADRDRAQAWLDSLPATH